MRSEAKSSARTNARIRISPESARRVDRLSRSGPRRSRAISASPSPIGKRERRTGMKARNPERLQRLRSRAEYERRANHTRPERGARTAGARQPPDENRYRAWTAHESTRRTPPSTPGPIARLEAKTAQAGSSSKNRPKATAG